MTLYDINLEYKTNLDYYTSLTNTISKNLDGRICHHRVILLSVLNQLLDINNYLEIGVHNGTSMSYMVVNNKNINAIGVDLFEDTISRYNHDNLQYNRTLKNIKKHNDGANITLIKGNSFLEKTIQKVDSTLNEDQVDLLFIDGDHSYKGISNDFNNYTKFVKTGGLIVIDDYNSQYPDIIRFCNEIEYSKFTKIGVFNNNELILIKK